MNFNTDPIPALLAWASQRVHVDQRDDGPGPSGDDEVREACKTLAAECIENGETWMEVMGREPEDNEHDNDIKRRAGA